jgi:hypothetical protein
MTMTYDTSQERGGGGGDAIGVRGGGAQSEGEDQ